MCVYSVKVGQDVLLVAMRVSGIPPEGEKRGGAAYTANSTCPASVVVMVVVMRVVKREGGRAGVYSDNSRPIAGTAGDVPDHRPRFSTRQIPLTLNHVHANT